MKKINAFTLVELIVVITILVILGTISFISLQNYSKEARDSKRISDIRSLLNKININNVNGTPYSDMLSHEKTNTGIIISGENHPSEQGITNFHSLKENGESFKDPLNGANYKFAYAIGKTISNDSPFSFTQFATITEKDGKALLIGNYYKIDDTLDSPSLFTNSGGIAIVGGGDVLPYGPEKENKPTPQPSNLTCTFDSTGDDGKFDTCKFGE